MKLLMQRARIKELEKKLDVLRDELKRETETANSYEKIIDTMVNMEHEEELKLRLEVKDLKRQRDILKSHLNLKYSEALIEWPRGEYFIVQVRD